MSEEPTMAEVIKRWRFPFDAEYDCTCTKMYQDRKLIARCSSPDCPVHGYGPKHPDIVVDLESSHA